MVDVFHRQVQLVFLVVRIATVLGSPISEHAGQRHFMALKEGHDRIVEQVGRRQRRLAVRELSKGYLGGGSKEGLLIDPAHALQGSLRIDAA